MRLMTVAALLCFGMTMQALPHPAGGIAVTGEAKPGLLALEKLLVVARMGAVTENAGVSAHGEKMVMRGEHLFSCRGMTGKAKTAVLNILAVTGGAALLKGGMDILPEHSLPVAAMRVMAGKAGLRLAGKILVAGKGARIPVAGQTELLNPAFQKLVVGTLMRLMAGGAPSLGKGLMAHPVLLFSLLMTGKTERSNRLAQQ